MKRNGIRVAVLGGGVAGLTCAHELVERGFDVTLVELRDEFGGRARSYTKTLTSPDIAPGTRGVGEHGFRFFPGFYQHIDDTTRRIPLPAVLSESLTPAPSDEVPAPQGHKTVFDCLLPIATEILAVPGKPIVSLPASAPLNVKTLRSVFQLPKHLVEIGLTNEDLGAFSDKLWQIATSSQERRDTEYEAIGWRDFIQSKNRSDEYYWYLASGLTRGLVAARARQASTKTMGNIALRMWTSLWNASKTTDRVLCGPTNMVWIVPWIKEIRRLARAGGCAFDMVHAKVEGIELANGRVTHVQAGGTTVNAEYFVSALPLRVLVGLIKDNTTDFGKAGGAQFERLEELADPGKDYLRTMSGIQIYLREDAPLNRGHQLFLDSPWGLTSLSQAQFWSDEIRAKALPDGAKGILSVDISSWDLPGVLGKEKRTAEQVLEAKDLGEQGIFLEVVAQIGSALGEALTKSLFGENNANVLGWHLDRGGDSDETMLVNNVGTWALRPDAETLIPNFFLAGDFARTETDLACMEGANEAARCAVNAVIAEVKASKQHDSSIAAINDCAVFAAPQSMLFAPLQQMDAYRYRQGLPWSGLTVGTTLLRGTQLAAAADEVVFARGLERPVLTGESGKTFEAPVSKDTTPRLSRAFWDSDAAAAVEVKALTPAEVAKKLGDTYATAGRADPIFKRWRPYELAGDKLGRLIPFHSYDSEGVILYGKAKKLDWLKAQTENTGWAPATAQVDGQEFGFAELWIIHYHDTTTGPYKELVINFVVTKGEHKPYAWKSKYSLLVPMNDPANRLFTPMLLLDAEVKGEEGPIAYGNQLLGTRKLAAKITAEMRADRVWTFSCKDENENPILDGSVDTKVNPLDLPAMSIELARATGPLEAVRDYRQRLANAELSGGLVTVQLGQDGKPKTSEVKAAYKFSPTLGVFNEGVNGEYTPGTDVSEKQKDKSSEFAGILHSMGFEPFLFAHDPHLKTVLSLATWPDPDGS
jgi:15-cis-phytoene desaturase